MKNLKNLIILACFLSFNYSLFAQDGLILPMPGMKPNNQNSSNQNKSSEQKQQNKQLTNTRASGSDDAIALVPPRTFTLEEALEFINDDEYVEVTPTDIRLRKAILNPDERRRANRK